MKMRVVRPTLRAGDHYSNDEVRSVRRKCRHPAYPGATDRMKIDFHRLPWRRSTDCSRKQGDPA